MPGTPVVSGAIAGTFLCGQKVAGEYSVSAPFALPVLTLQPRITQVFDTTPTIVGIGGRPELTLLARTFALEIRSTQPVNKATLLLVPREVQGVATLFAEMRMPTLTLQARAFLPSSSSSTPVGKPKLELVARPTKGRLAILFPAEEEDLILVPTVPEDGDWGPGTTLLLTPVVEETILLTPTNEAVG